MHANILAGSTREARETFLRSLLTSHHELLHLFTNSTFLTIKQVHDLLASLGTVARLSRIIWIEEANLLTLPAQNAILKVLEEPPLNTTIYLTCHSAQTLLPTIRSRCAIINLPNSANLPNSENLLSDLKSIMSLSAGDRLAGLGKMDRATALAWFASLEIALRTQLHARFLSPSQLSTLGKIAKLALTAHSQLLSNCSVSLVRESFLLGLPHIV
ncbi:MAG: hypothetical protein V1487_04025 [bacterium]